MWAAAVRSVKQDGACEMCPSVEEIIMSRTKTSRGQVGRDPIVSDERKATLHAAFLRREFFFFTQHFGLSQPIRPLPKQHATESRRQIVMGKLSSVENPEECSRPWGRLDR